MKMPFSRATSRMVWSSRAPTSLAVDGQGFDADVGCSCGHLLRLWPRPTVQTPARAALVARCGRCTRRGSSAACSAPDSGAVWPRPHRLVLATRSHSCFEQREVAGRRASPSRDLLQDVVHLRGADAAGNALAARLASCRTP